MKPAPRWAWWLLAATLVAATFLAVVILAAEQAAR